MAALGGFYAQSGKNVNIFSAIVESDRLLLELPGLGDWGIRGLKRLLEKRIAIFFDFAILAEVSLSKRRHGAGVGYRKGVDRARRVANQPVAGRAICLFSD